MTGIPVSVVVVSRNRPNDLLRCVTGLEQLDYPTFEIVLVADSEGLRRVAQAGFDGRVKAIRFEQANISAARNLGITAAAGELIAFIDDDAVPEPSWLRHLTAPFVSPQVEAAGGYVIGRNGISFQHRGRRVDALGRHRAINPSQRDPVILPSQPGDAVKTEGTNCAFRAGVLREVGGFDPALHFYLDETDVNLRLADRFAKTALVPLAQVHHGFAASDRRGASRAPKTLFDIGASSVVFLRKHAMAEMPSALDTLRSDQRRRLQRFMVSGLLEPRDISCLMRSLEEGIHAGRDREISRHEALSDAEPPFLQFQARTVFQGMHLLFGRSWQGARLRREARTLLEQGSRVSLYLFGPTAMYHTVCFDVDGYWVQKGGLFGRSVREGPLVRWTSFRRRLREETERVAEVRQLPGTNPTKDSRSPAQSS